MEIPICQYCNETVRTNIEDFVIENRGEDDASYAHAECYEEYRAEQKKQKVTA